MANCFDAKHNEFSTEPKVITQELNDNEDYCCKLMIDHFDVEQYNTINVEFSTEPDVKNPKLSHDRSLYIIYSPGRVKLRPWDSTMVNLKLKINLPDNIEGMIGLLPSFFSRKPSIENSNWISNKRKD